MVPDQIPNDERFLAPFREKFYTRVGRPTIPIATYLRMMYLKCRYKPGCETPVKEVSDSFMQSRLILRQRRQLEGWLGVTEKIVEQTEQVVKGRLRIPRRVVSIFDTGARPIRRGKGASAIIRQEAKGGSRGQELLL